MALAMPALSSLTWPARSSLDTVTRYDKELKFIEDMMIDDLLWEQIIQKRVKIPPPVVPVNHFAEEQPPRPDSGAAPALVVSPFDEVVKLMSANSKCGTDVAFVAESVRRAVACSVSQHVSMQAFLLHHLYAAEPKSKALPYVTGWLKQMTQLAVDKLTAVDWSMPAVGLLHRHALELLRNADANHEHDESVLPEAYANVRLDKLLEIVLPEADAHERLAELGESVLLEADAVCARADGRGVYAELIANLKSSATDEQLGKLEYMMANNDDVQGLPELNELKLMQRDHGSLTVDDNVDPAGLGRLSADELKKMLTVNRVMMNYLYKNLPVAALATSQWEDLLALNEQRNDPLVGHRNGGHWL